MAGLSEALKEEVTFDKSRVTSTNWDRYKILTMEEMPEIKIVPLSRETTKISVAARKVPPMPSALQQLRRRSSDATGIQARRIPLSPAYVTTLLKG